MLCAAGVSITVTETEVGMVPANINQPQKLMRTITTTMDDATGSGERLFTEEPAGIERLRQRLLTMGDFSQDLINQALQALIQRDPELAQRVQQSDHIVDQCEIAIDDLVIQELAKAPLAGNLRMVTSVMKISHHLERIGDESTKIAKQVSELCLDPTLKIELGVPQMAILAVNMLKVALAAFENRDGVAARALIPNDKEIDTLNKTIRQKLMEHMVGNPHTTKCCLRWMVIAKSLERIADHATNVAEEVVFLCEGRDIRHSGLRSGAFRRAQPAESQG